METVQASIELLGVQVNEPVTTLTDMLVAATCFYAWFMLRKSSAATGTRNNYIWFFFVMGLAASLGGIIGHGFIYLFNERWVLPGWGASIIGINLLAKALILDSREYIKPQAWKAMYILNILELPLFLALLVLSLDFTYVLLYSAYGLVLIPAILGSILYIRSSQKGYIYIMSTSVLTALAAICFVADWNIHNTWFRSPDTGHLLLAVNAYLVYTGSGMISRSGVSAGT